MSLDFRRLVCRCYHLQDKRSYYFREGILRQTEHPLSDLTEDSVRTLVELSSCASEAVALRCLQQLDSAVDVKQPMTLLKTFSKFALVSVGDEARARWRQSDASSVPWLLQHVNGKFSVLYSSAFFAGFLFQGRQNRRVFRCYVRGSGFSK